ncbi:MULTISPECIES: LysE family translocator [Thermomonosporaceae]|uniref:LysE family translocator n=1 Tax=Thermomonosporaceae TaxID=2012 RepID=UPI00255B0918|nr:MULTISPECIES: LysE family translocator [Thermomonosporaceae]MDL4775329.1 LysE family translocator [Actinomadura xylanilytica]
MSSGNPYLVFAGLALTVVLMPGADTILVFRTSRAHGTRLGLTTAAGVVTGPVIWGMLSGVGVALIVARNATVYRALALFGALYLLYLAAGCLRAAATGTVPPLDGEPNEPNEPNEANEADAAVPGGTPRNAYVTGLLTNLLNPKIGVFYLSIMPGLFHGTPDLWVGGSLGLIQASMGIVFLGLVAVLSGRARRYLAGRRASAAVELLAGGCLAAFALYTAWSALRAG